MFREIFIREIRYTLSFPLTYLSLLLYIAFSVFLYSRGLVFVGTLIEQELVNSPHVITANIIFFSLLGLVVAIPVFYNAANREFQNGFQEILFSTPITKAAFFWGRFLGAFSLLLLPAVLLIGINILGVKIGLGNGSILPEEVMAFRVSTFFKTMLFIVLPNIFIVGSFLFGMAVHFRHLGFVIFSALFLNMLYLLAMVGLNSDLNDASLAALIDPFGEQAFNLDTRYFTAVERNQLDVKLSGHLLRNRLLWLFLSSTFLGLAYLRFSWQIKFKKANKKLHSLSKTPLLILPQTFPLVSTHFGIKTQWMQFVYFFKNDFRHSFGHLTFRLLMLPLGLMLIFDFINRHHDYGVAQLPLTYIIIEHIRDSDILPMILLIYLTGELVWTNRQVGIDEVIDATPHHAALALFARAMALFSVMMIAFGGMFLIGVALQLANGFTQIDLWHYLTEWWIQLAPSLLFWVCLSLLLQNLVNHKFVAYAFALFFFVGQVIWFQYFDLENYMLRLGSTGFYQYSDFNAYGPFLTTNVWLGIYWILASGIFLMLAFVVSIRGKESKIKDRILSGKNQLTPALFNMCWALLASWLLCSGFIFYNTKILNHYSTSGNTNDIREQYERRYKQYEPLLQPQISQAKFEVAIFPNKRSMQSKTALQLRNPGNQAIPQLVFSTRNYNQNNAWESQINIPGATLLHDDDYLGFQIYQLATPLLPQDSMAIEVSAAYTSKGFENTVENTDILDNGTFFHHAQIIPFLGYRKEGEITDPKERKKRNLPERFSTPPLTDDTQDPNLFKNYLIDQHSWVDMETIISTSSDQIALSSGSLMREWREGNRRYFHYRTDHPSLLFNCFISARYQVAKKKWKDVDLEIYYDEKHAYNIEVMLTEMENALEYFTENFGPYFHQQVRIVEFPQYANYAQAFPGIMPYSESRGFVLDFQKDRDNHPIASTIGHEISHQWWGHQLIGADMQGSRFLSESFAEYASLMMMKKELGAEGMIDFLEYDYDDYLQGRLSERYAEQALYRVEDQPYLYYRKGSVVMYALAILIGEDRVNRALRNFLEEFRYQKPPYPRSLDFLPYLECEIPDSLQYLMADMFYDITFYDNAIETATFKPLANGQFQLKLSISAKKLKLIDKSEQEVPINDWWEISIYSDSEGKNLISRASLKLDGPQLHFDFLLDQKPGSVRLDPRFLFFDRNRLDNHAIVKEKK